jgi:hypothetical protein
LLELSYIEHNTPYIIARIWLASLYPETVNLWTMGESQQGLFDPFSGFLPAQIFPSYVRDMCRFFYLKKEALNAS